MSRTQDPVNRISHRGANKHECPECREEFATWQKCCLHLWREHGQDLELITCDSCEYRSFTPAVMEKHKLSHSEQRSFLCPDCGRAYKAQNQLKEHMKCFHEKTVSGERYSGEEEEEGEGGRGGRGGGGSGPEDETLPRSDKTCDICRKSFNSEREVRYHKERVHEKLRPWHCEVCGYAAFSHKTLRLHIRSHTGAKPYSCSECEYRTGQCCGIKIAGFGFDNNLSYQGLDSTRTSTV